MVKSKLAIFASGSGTNAESIMRYFQDDERVEVVLLLSNNPLAGVLPRADHFNIPTRIFNNATFRDASVILGWLRQYEVTHIVLAGFLLLMPEGILGAFHGRIINIHPSLLPKFSGKGMYGMNVHEAVRRAQEKETGITIHIVNENYDEGEILFQISVPVMTDDSPEEIANKVHQLEQEHFPKIIEAFVLNHPGAAVPDSPSVDPLEPS